MQVAAVRPDEEECLAALMDLDILDTAPAAEFDIFPALARQVFSAPIAAISFIDRRRQWFKAQEGLGATETSRESSFCAHAILRPNEVLCVPDARLDARFADNPLVRGSPGIRFYIGIPIVGPSGHPLGTLCVIDHEPRQVNQVAIDHLQQLGMAVETTLRLHASVITSKRLANTDALTGLQNRSAFNLRLEAALSSNRAGAGHVGLLFLDLDHFKKINDVFGHMCGDAALCEVGRRLRGVVREQDGVFRFGGDEFCILVEKVQEASDLQCLAERIHRAMAEPWLADQHPIPLRTSIGVARCAPGEADIDALIRRADAAVYEAKQLGRGLTQFAQTSRMPILVGGRNEVEKLLRDALVPGQEPFQLAYQPIFSEQGRRLSGFEALIRWVQPDGRVMPPAEFVPVAEATGLILDIDRWVLNQACATAASWPEDLQVSTNLSAANFMTGDLADQVRSTLARHRLSPRRLKLEVTETLLLPDPPGVRKQIAILRAMGVQVMLDDFGTGHSSLAYLRDYEFDGLKIDRTFVAKIERDLRSQAFVRAIIEMARILGIGTTAEGVETSGQLEALLSSGVETVQGYLLGRPMSQHAASALAWDHVRVAV